jgi:hypothetical protein
MKQLARIVLAAASVALVGACSTSPAPSPTPGLSGEPTAQPTETASPAPASAAPTPDDQVGAVDAICRESSFRDPGRLTISVTVGELVTIVYTDPEGDSICQWLPRYGDSAVIQGPSEHLADRLTDAAPLATDPGMSWTGETGTYVWGAIGPDVASVIVELEGATEPLEAAIADGYFLAVIGPDLPCCVFTTIALDASGQELAREP